MTETPSSIDYAQLVAQAGDGIVVADPQGKIILWNAAATRIFGFTPEEAIGQSLDLITPERYRQRHWHGYDETMKSGTTRYGAELLRVPALHKEEGKTLSIAFTVALLKDAAGAVNGIVAIVRDETSRFADEREMRRKIAALEEAASKGDAR